MNSSFLISDVVYLLINSFIVGFLYLSFQNPFNKRIWLKLFQQRTAAISLGIVVFFWLISILDSIHIYQNTLIDWIFSPLNHYMEYSYSKPFSLNLLLPKVKFLHGQYVALYSHLTYVPKVYQTQAQMTAWVSLRVLHVLGGFFILLFILRVIFRRRLALIFPYQKNILLMWGSLLFCTTIFILLYVLSRQFHVFGTGQIGQDILYQAIKSIRTGMLISLMTTMIMLPFAIAFGLVAGYFGGTIDLLVQFIYTTISSIPGVLFIGASLLSWQIYMNAHHSNWSIYQIADSRLMMICILLGLSDWSSLCRYIRAEVLKIRELDYVISAKILGSSNIRILVKHILPNTMHMIITTIVLNFSYLVLAESVLTYLGIGVSPLTISWGNMINAARLELARDPMIWWPLMAAFIFMFFLVLSCNLLADSLRKALNPREEV
jgi:peptide/nickel transport system permease protein